MSNLYQVVPLEKKSVIYNAEMYRKNSDDSISWFNVSTTYRSGQGFLEDAIDLPYKGDKEVRCQLATGWGCELDDVISCSFEFSEDISEKEQEEIQDSYYEGFQGWIYDGDHDWEIEIDEVCIHAPYQINLVNGVSGDIVEESVALADAPQYDPDAKLSWVFPTGSPE